MRTHFFNAVRDDRKTDIIVEFAATGGDPGNTYGLPENCWPAEAPEVEIVAAWLDADSNNLKAPQIKLTDAEHERICVEILESPDAIPDDYPEDY